MALKQYKNVESTHPVSAPSVSSSPSVNDDWEGPWGKINPTEVRFIHFVRNNRSVEEVWTYPYEPLMRWVFKKSEPQQELEIYSGGDKIVLRGHSLEKFLEPLEKRCLERVEQRTIRFAAAEPNGCCVTEIKIESSQG